MLLKLENTVTHSVYEYDVEDKNEGKKLYFQFDINSLNLDDGEYKLHLFNGDELVYTDLLRIGNFNPDTLQYNKGANTFINVDYNVKLEDKNEQINEVSTVIYPDDGFDAMTSVNVDAQPLYNTAYSIGYDRGYNEGIVDLSFIGYNNEESEAITNALIVDPAQVSKTYYENWDENRTSASKYFENSDIIIAPLINTENVTNMYRMFYNCSNLTYIPQLNTSNVIDMSSMFGGCLAFETIPELDTSNVTDMEYMFGGCLAFETMPELDTSNVTNMNRMFRGCKSLKTIPSLNTSNVSEMDYMFSGCTSLQTIPEIDTSNVVNMGYIFDSCTSLETIPLIDMSNVVGLGGMFSGCTSLQTIPPLNISKVTAVNFMFQNCHKLTSVPSLDLGSVIYSSAYMYSACSNLKTVGEFSAPQTASVESMFSYCYDLETIGSYEHYLDLGSCSTTSYMFRDCYSLKELPIINCPSISTESAFFGSTYYLYDLVEVGGCISKHNQNGTNKWARCPNLSQASIQRIINCLYDFIGNGSSTRKSISFNTNSQSLVTDEMIAQATNKGWTIDFKSPSHSN